MREEKQPEEETSQDPATLADTASSDAPSAPAETPTQAEGAAAADATPPQGQPEGAQPRPEGKVRRFFRRLLRWAVGLLVVFGLGFVAALWALYLPMRAQASQAQTEAQKAAQEVETLKGQLADAQQQIQTLKQQLQDAQQHTADLQTRLALTESLADAYATRLALKEGDAVGAGLYMDAMLKSLDALRASVPAEHVQAVQDMVQQAEEIRSNLDSPSYADRKLRGLVQNLQALEDVLFPQP